MKTTKQVGELLGIQYRSVIDRIKSGTVEATKIGRDWIIHDDEYERLKEELKTKNLE